jgi:hypothetical protein
VIIVLKLDSLLKRKKGEPKNKKKIIEQTHEESNAYSLFVFTVRSQITRDYYLRRLIIFFD